MADGRFLTEAEAEEYAGGSAAVARVTGGGATGQARQDQALEKAEGEVLNYLGSRYDLPTTPATTPDGLKHPISESFVYWLHLTAENLYDEALKVRHDEVLRFYREVAAGRAAVSGLSEPTTGQSIRATVSLPREVTRPVGRGLLDSYRPGGIQ